MRREEERIRAMTTEALALKAQEKQAQIETAIAKSQMALTTNLARICLCRRGKRSSKQRHSATLSCIGKAVQIGKAMSRCVKDWPHCAEAKRIERLV